jgi:hypothetical protein
MHLHLEEAHRVYSGLMAGKYEPGTLSGLQTFLSLA